MVSAVLKPAGFGIDGYSGVVSYMLFGPGSDVEQRGFAAVWVSYKSHVDSAAYVFEFTAKAFALGGAVAVELLCLLLAVHRHHLYQSSLRRTQRHIVAHNAVFDGVFQRSVQQHLYRMALYKAHLDNAFTEGAVA